MLKMARAIRWAGDCDGSKQRDRRVVMSTTRSGWKEEQVSVKYCMTRDTNLLGHSEQKIANCLALVSLSSRFALFRRSDMFPWPSRSSAQPDIAESEASVRLY